VWNLVLKPIPLILPTHISIPILSCRSRLFTQPFLSFSPCLLSHPLILPSPSHSLTLSQVIEQLHILTNEVLRVYPSGSIAASFLNVSQVRNSNSSPLLLSPTPPNRYPIPLHLPSLSLEYRCAVVALNRMHTASNGDSMRALRLTVRPIRLSTLTCSNGWLVSHAL
jgi:hypothetical protein